MKKISYFNYHNVRKSQICSLNKLTTTELYLFLVDTNTVYFNIISRIFLDRPSLTRKKYIFQFVTLVWIQSHVCSSRKFYIIFYMQTECFLNLEE